MSNHLVKLSENDLSCLLQALRNKRLKEPFSELSIQRLLSSSQSKHVARELRELSKQGLSIHQVSLVIETLHAQRSYLSSCSSIVDLVTTGPEVGGVTNRDTRIVVRDLFANAKNSILLSGYAVYQGQVVFEALADRLEEDSSLKVRLFLDIHRSLDDNRASKILIERFRSQFKKYQWPQNKPLPEVFYYPSSLEIDASKRSVLHAKCIVVDSNKVFVSSANFTEAAQNRNIEIGLLLSSPSLAKRIIWHFETLLEDGILVALW